MPDPERERTPKPNPKRPRKGESRKLTRERLYRALGNAVAFRDEVDEFGLGGDQPDATSADEPRK